MDEKIYSKTTYSPGGTILYADKEIGSLEELERQLLIEAKQTKLKRIVDKKMGYSDN